MKDGTLEERRMHEYERKAEQRLKEMKARVEDVKSDRKSLMHAVQRNTANGSSVPFGATSGGASASVSMSDQYA